ncbi:MAG: HAD-IA family hydrolase [Bryobacteraceae bacterium]
MVTLSCRAILFDMDGTLVDSSAVIRRTWEWWSSLHGIPLAPILAVEKGRPTRDVLSQFGPHLDIEAEAARFLECEENDTEGLVAIPGALEAVAAAQQGLWAVVTSAHRSLGEIRLRAAGLPIPGVFITADLIHRGKPDPESYLLAAQQLKVEPPDCVVFEDAPAGIEAARSAGMSVVGVLTALTSEELSAPLDIGDFHDVTISRRENGGFDLSLNTR